MRKKIIIFSIILLILILLIHHFNHDEMLIKQDGNIKVVYEYQIFPAHYSGHHSLYYKNKLICSSVGGDETKYLISPNSKSMLYINFDCHRYELYNFEGNKIVFPNERYLLLVGFDGKIEWSGDKVYLTNLKETQQDVLDFKKKSMQVIKLKEG